MSSGDKCRECGTAIPADSPGGFCAQCLLALGLEKRRELADAGPSASASEAPTKPEAEDARFPNPPAEAATVPGDRVVASPPVEKAGDRIGRYRLLQEIGHGGCGVVYMAEQEQPVRRRVALKVIKLGMDTKQVVARFEAERQALAMMDHPHIAKVLDAGATELGRPYFVMELVGGIKITDYCNENKLTTRQRLDLFIQVCHAIQHAHQKGIIHRDIKPSNVLVALQDGVPVPKVIDFGIAKATQGRLTDQTLFTAFEQFIGTPAYMSPEQAQVGGLGIDTRSDIYALGVLLYELLTGQTPFDAKALLAAGLEEMRRTIREKEPARPSTRLSTMLEGELTATARIRQTDAPKLIHLVRGDLDWIVMKCLEKDRARRYETANGLAMDLERHLTNEPVIARPPSTAYRLQKAFRRNKLAFSAAATVGAALVIGIGISSWQTIRARHAEREQNRLRELAVTALAGEKEQSRIADKSAKELRDNLYASEMSAAFGAFRAGSIQRSRDLLNRQSKAAIAELRGFEWRWLWGQTRAAEASVLTAGAGTTVSAVDFSPDGRRFLTFDANSLKIWDTATHELVRSNSHDFGYHAEFSRDGKFIVSTDFGGQLVRLWNAASGVLLTNLTGHTRRVLSAIFSPDGRLLASTAASPYSKRDGELFLWDVVSHERVDVLKEPGTEFIFRPRFSPDSRLLAAGGGSGHILLWDVATRRIISRLTGHKGAVTAVCFTADGKRLVSGGLDRTVRLWDVNEGKETSLLGLHEKGVWGVAVSPDGRWAATTGFDHMVKLWDLERPGLFRTFRGHQARAVGVAFHPDGSTLATTSLDGTVRFWKMPQSSDEWVLDGTTGSSFGFASKNRLLLGLSMAEHLDIWDVAAKKRLIHIAGDNAVWVPNSERMLFHRGLQLIELDVPSESEQVLGVAGETEEGLTGIACSSDGRLFAWGHGDHAHVFDRTSGAEVSRLNTGEKGAEQIAFSPDNTALATAGDGPGYTQPGVIQLWDTASWRVRKSLAGHRMGIKAIRFSPDGRLLASSSSDRTTRLWSLSTGEQVILQDDEGEPPSLAFSPDGRTLAVGTYEGSVRLWNVATRHQIASFEAGASIVNSVNFSPDGSALSSVTLDGKVRVWQAPSWAEINAAEAK